MKKLIVLAVSALLSATAFAHSPAIFTGESFTKRASVAVDVTKTEGVYRVDFATDVDEIKVYAPNGKAVRRFGTVTKSTTRTAFDLDTKEAGTYKIVYGSGKPSYSTIYYIKKDGEKKRKYLRANTKEAAKQLPKDAFDVVTSKNSKQAIAYVTAKTASKAVLKVANKGFELKHLTHPTAYKANKKVRFKVLFNGKPVANAEVKIEAEQSKYQKDAKTIKTKSNKKGVVALELEAGRYLAAIKYSKKSKSDLADKESYSISYAFEVNVAK